MRMFPERNSPNILKKEKTLQRTSPAVHMTVAFQPISRGIIRKVTRRSAIACGSGKNVSQKICEKKYYCSSEDLCVVCCLEQFAYLIFHAFQCVQKPSKV